MCGVSGGIIGGGWAGMGSRALTDLCRGRWRVKAPRRFGGHFRTAQEHRDFVSIGTAAGVCWCPLLRQQAPCFKCLGCTACSHIHGQLPRVHGGDS